MPVLLIQSLPNSQEHHDRLTEKDPLDFSTASHAICPLCWWMLGKRFQTIEGFGGAFTEAAADTFYKMSPEIRAEILKAYFDPVRR